MSLLDCLKSVMLLVLCLVVLSTLILESFLSEHSAFFSLQ